MDSLHLGLFISICILLCIVTAMLIFLLALPMIPCLIALALSIILIYLNPAKLNYDQEINDAKDHYDKYTDKTSYFSKQLKHVWQNALADQINYYIIVAVVIIYMPFFIYIIYLLDAPYMPPTPTQPGTFSIADYFPPLYIINLFVMLFTCIYVFIYGYSYAYLIIPMMIGLGTFTYLFLI
jgi:hypothetical protein